MAQFDNLEFVISANTSLLRGELSRGTDAVNAFASKTETSLSKHNTTLEHVSRTTRRLFELYGAFGAVRAFDAWIEGAIKTNRLTQEQFQHVTSLREAMKDVKNVSDDLAISIGSALAPKLETAARFWRELVFPTKQEQSVAPLTKEIQASIDKIDEIKRGIADGGSHGSFLKGGLYAYFFGGDTPENLKVQLQAAERSLVDLFNKRQELQSKGTAGPVLGAFVTPEEDAALTNFIAEMNNAVSDRQVKEDQFLTNFIADMNNAVSERARNEDEFLNNFIGEMNTAVREREMQGQKLSPELAGFIDQVERADALTRSVMTPIEEVKASYRDAQELFSQGLISEETVARSSEAGKKMQEFADAFAYTFESRGIQALLDGDVSGAFKGLIRDLAEMVLRLAILQPIAEKFAATMKGSVGGGTNSGSGWSTLFSSLFGSISGKAAGGPVNAGQPYIVGEKGPELWVPDSSGHIYPNGMGGSVNVTQHIHYDVSLESVDNRIAQSAGAISNLALMAVRNAMTRPKMA